MPRPGRKRASTRPPGGLSRYESGASASLLRSSAFFHGYGSGVHLLVLAVWTGCGLTAVLASEAVRRRRAVSAAGRHAEISAAAGKHAEISVAAGVLAG